MNKIVKNQSKNARYRNNSFLEFIANNKKYNYITKELIYEDSPLVLRQYRRDYFFPYMFSKLIESENYEILLKYINIFDFSNKKPKSRFLKNAHLEYNFMRGI